jgi:hypothetical protein
MESGSQKTLRQGLNEAASHLVESPTLSRHTASMCYRFRWRNDEVEAGQGDVRSVG